MINRGISQKQYLAMYLDNTTRYRQIKIDIHDKGLKVDSLVGKCTGGNISISNQSAYRRTGNVSLILSKELLPQHNGVIWFNKIADIKIGISYMGEIIWYDLGEFAISNVNISKGTNSGAIQLELLDKMAFLDGTLGGESEYKLGIKAKKGMKVNDVIKATVESIPEVSIEQFQIDGIDAVIPYDIEFDYGVTVYEVLKRITDLYMHQEFFFDTQGVLKVQRIQNRATDSLIWDFSEPLMNTIISPTNNIYFSNVKNMIRVWGGIDKGTGRHYNYRLRNCGRVDDLSSIDSPDIGDLYNVDGQTYMWDDEWIESDINIINEFSIHNIGQKNKIINDESIMTDSQAKTRCIYELKKSSNLATKISLSSIPIYLLDVNTKIHINEHDIGLNGDFLITSINLGLGLTDDMNINAEKIYY